jgi:hypothetical protein
MEWTSIELSSFLKDWIFEYIGLSQSWNLSMLSIKEPTMDFTSPDEWKLKTLLAFSVLTL